VLADRLRSGDIGTALDNNDRDGLSAALESAGNDAAALKKDLEDSGADPVLIAAAAAFTRGLNGLDATFSAETIRQDDLLGSMEEIADGHGKLAEAKESVGQDCE